MKREMFTRAEVEKVLREAMFSVVRSGSLALRGEGDRVGADVLERMAMKVRRDDDLVTRVMDDAEDKAGLSKLVAVS